MTSVAFQPRGDRPEWTLVYDHLVGLEPGDVITYEELDQLLEREFRPDRHPLYTARDHLLHDHLRTLVCEVNKGYRIASADEHTQVARGHERRAGRQVRKAANTLSLVRLEEMSPDRRKLRDIHLLQLGAIEQLVRTLGRRVRGVEIRQDVSDETLETVERRLAAIESRMSKVVTS